MIIIKEEEEKVGLYSHLTSESATFKMQFRLSPGPQQENHKGPLLDRRPPRDPRYPALRQGPGIRIIHEHLRIQIYVLMTLEDTDLGL